MARPRSPANQPSITASVDAVGRALGELLKAYEALGGSITQQQHSKVFAHLRGSLSVIQDKCDNARTLGQITAGGFSLDGPEADFVGSGDAVPVTRLRAAIEANPPTVVRRAAPKAATANVVPIGRLSKHADEQGAGEKFFAEPSPPPAVVADDTGVDFITD